MRINEFRRVGVNKPSTYITCFYGENGAYDCVADRHLYQTAPLVDREGKKWPMRVEDVSEQLMPEFYTKYKRGEEKIWRIYDWSAREWCEYEWDDNKSPVSIVGIEGAAPIQNRERLPKSFREYGIKSGSHFASHPFLIDDFVRAVVENKLPPNNAWDSARYMIPGLVAHESAIQGGKLLDIPDFGDAPDDWEKLTFEKKDYYDED